MSRSHKGESNNPPSSEGLLRETLLSVLEHTDTAVVEQDRKLRCVRMSGRLGGLEAKDIVGKSDRDFLSADDANHLTAIKEEVLKTRGRAHEIIQVTIGDLSRHFALLVHPLYQDGDLIGVRSIWTDVTARMEALEIAKRGDDRIRTLLDSFRDIITVVPIDTKGVPGSFIEVNKQTCKLLGYSREELLQLTPSQLFDPSIALDRKADIEKLVADGGVTVERVVRTKDGLSIPLEVRAVQFEFHGRPAVLSISRDISKRRQAENALRESEQRYRELFENMTNGATLLHGIENGEDFIVDEVNSVGCRLCGLEREDMIGRRIREVLPGVEMLGLFDILKRVHRSGQPERLPLALYQDDKVQEWVEGYVYRLNSGELVAIFTNLTSKMELEARLQGTVEDLQREHAALESKSIALAEVLNQINHEKRKLALQVQSNVDQVVLPLLCLLEEQTGQSGRELVRSLKRSLGEITAPYVNLLTSTYSDLTPAEIRVCTMVRQGMTSKEIAAALNISEETVRGRRKRIRRKLGIAQSGVGLAAYLHSLSDN